MVVVWGEPGWWVQGPGQPGPGPLGPGAWGLLGPRCGIRVESVTTHCQASYLLSGLSIYCQTCTQPLHRLAPNKRILAPKSFRIDAPNNRILAPNRSIDMHPTSAYMHPRVSAYFAPNNRIDAPNNRIHAPNRSIDMHPKSAYMQPTVYAYMHTKSPEVQS